MWLLQVFFVKCCIFNLYPFWGNFNPRNTGCGKFFHFLQVCPPLARPTSSTEPGVLVIRIPTVRGPVTQVLGGRKP